VPASTRHRRAAAWVVTALSVVAVLALFLRSTHGPAIPATVDIDQSLICVAYLLTAYLLFSQFASTGLLVLAIVGAGYAFVGLVQIPVLLEFPGAFYQNALIGGRYSAVWLGPIWHVIFPILAILLAVYDPAGEAQIEEKSRRVVIRLMTGLVALVVALEFVISAAASPPQALRADHLTPMYMAFSGAVIVLSFGGTLFYAIRTRAQTILQLWLSVGLFGMSLELFLYAASDGRYTASWYISKGLALIAASIVLLILLRQVSKLYRRIADLATTDELTGLANRRTLDSHLDWMVRYGGRHGVSMGIVMVDVDHFKKYNDTYGHAAGDDVLRHVANTLRANVLRASDLVARYGGEEFVAMLPDATREGTQLAVERMRTALERLNIPHSSAPRGRVTLSVGAAVGKLDEVGPYELLRAADEALYSAKTSGRNRSVVVAAGAAAPTARLGILRST
jgi:diguanylate cyclase (GGDEF)-like protein